METANKEKVTDDVVLEEKQEKQNCNKEKEYTIIATKQTFAVLSDNDGNLKSIECYNKNLKIGDKILI